VQNIYKNIANGDLGIDVFEHLFNAREETLPVDKNVDQAA